MTMESLVYLSLDIGFLWLTVQYPYCFLVQVLLLTKQSDSLLNSGLLHSWVMVGIKPFTIELTNSGEETVNKVWLSGEKSHMSMVLWWRECWTKNHTWFPILAPSGAGREGGVTRSPNLFQLKNVMSPGVYFTGWAAEGKPWSSVESSLIWLCTQTPWQPRMLWMMVRPEGFFFWIHTPDLSLSIVN